MSTRRRVVSRPGFPPNAPLLHGGAVRRSAYRRESLDLRPVFYRYATYPPKIDQGEGQACGAWRVLALPRVRARPASARLPPPRRSEHQRAISRGPKMPKFEQFAHFHASALLPKNRAPSITRARRSTGTSHKRPAAVVH